MKTALVTGSSRGIGAETARGLANDGWKVVLHYTRSVSDAEEVERSLGAACLGKVQADLMSPSDTARLWLEASQLAKIDALVNNAGVYVQAPFVSEFSAAVRARMFRINFEAPCELMHFAVTEFQKRGEGKVLNVASRVGFRGESGAAMYAASKAALINVTRSLAVEFGGTKIGFFGIAPGWVDTAMARDGMDNRLEEILSTIPAGRMASPKDCAHVAKFLLSEGSEYLSGTIVDINGASYFH